MSPNGGGEEDGTGQDDNADETTSQAESPNQLTNVTLSLDSTLELLSDYQRRAILQFLVETPDNTATINELVNNLAEQEGARTGERPGHNRVEASLYHIHIPKLADAGVIDYDARSKEVRYWRNDRLETWLDRIRAEETG